MRLFPAAPSVRPHRPPSICLPQICLPLPACHSLLPACLPATTCPPLPARHYLPACLPAPQECVLPGACGGHVRPAAHGHCPGQRRDPIHRGPDCRLLVSTQPGCWCCGMRIRLPCAAARGRAAAPRVRPGGGSLTLCPLPPLAARRCIVYWMVGFAAEACELAGPPHAACRTPTHPPVVSCSRVGRGWRLSCQPAALPVPRPLQPSSSGSSSSLASRSACSPPME